MARKAIALQYETEDTAPKITAKGAGQVAETILRIARESGVHVEDNSLLSEALMQFEVGDYIPRELYEIVAEILAFVYRLDLD